MAALHRLLKDTQGFEEGTGAQASNRFQKAIRAPFFGERSELRQPERPPRPHRRGTWKNIPETIATLEAAWGSRRPAEISDIFGLDMDEFATTAVAPVPCDAHDQADDARRSGGARQDRRITDFRWAFTIFERFLSDLPTGVQAISRC